MLKVGGLSTKHNFTPYLDTLQFFIIIPFVTPLNILIVKTGGDSKIGDEK